MILLFSSLPFVSSSSVRSQAFFLSRKFPTCKGDRRTIPRRASNCFNVRMQYSSVYNDSGVFFPPQAEVHPLVTSACQSDVLLRELASLAEFNTNTMAYRRCLSISSKLISRDRLINCLERTLQLILSRGFHLFARNRNTTRW